MRNGFTIVQRMHPARIAELLQPFLDSAADQPLTPGDLLRISTYIDLLQRWNARINLTAIRDPEQIVTRHFGESLFAARHLFPMRLERLEPVPESEDRVRPEDVVENDRGRAALQGRDRAPKHAGALAPVPRERLSLADVGSGAGFPGIPIKLWAPHLSLTLIESNQKKAIFLREVVRALTLTDVNIQTARAETLPARSFNVVTLRAVERFATILPAAAQLVRPAGRLALLIGATQQDQAHQTLPGLLWSDPLPIPTSRNRILLIARVPSGT